MRAFVAAQAGSPKAHTETGAGEVAMASSKESLFSRLGGYDAISAVVDELLPRLRAGPLLQRFWMSPRSTDTNIRERRLP
jgi:hypothetical protein